MARGQLVTILAGAGLLLLVLEIVRRRRLREEHALPWLLTGLALIALGVMPRLLWSIAPLLGVEYPPILLPVVGLFLLLVVVFSQGMAISEMSRKNRDLAQQVAIMGWQMKHMHREVAHLNQSSSLAPGPSLDSMVLQPNGGDVDQIDVKQE